MDKFGPPDGSTPNVARIFLLVSPEDEPLRLDHLGRCLREHLTHRAHGGQREQQDGPGDLQAAVLAFQPVEALSQLAQLIHHGSLPQRHVTPIAVTSLEKTYRPTRCTLPKVPVTVAALPSLQGERPNENTRIVRVPSLRSNV